LGNGLDNLTNSGVTEYSIGGKFEQMGEVMRLQVTGAIGGVMGYEKKVMRMGRDARVESGENKNIGFR
jgi:hypothetical protein